MLKCQQIQLRDMKKVSSNVFYNKKTEIVPPTITFSYMNSPIVLAKVKRNLSIVNKKPTVVSISPLFSHQASPEQSVLCQPLCFRKMQKQKKKSLLKQSKEPSLKHQKSQTNFFREEAIKQCRAESDDSTHKEAKRIKTDYDVEKNQIWTQDSPAPRDKNIDNIDPYQNVEELLSKVNATLKYKDNLIMSLQKKIASFESRSQKSSPNKNDMQELAFLKNYITTILGEKQEIYQQLKYQSEKNVQLYKKINQMQQLQQKNQSKIIQKQNTLSIAMQQLQRSNMQIIKQRQKCNQCLQKMNAVQKTLKTVEQKYNSLIEKYNSLQKDFDLTTKEITSSIRKSQSEKNLSERKINLTVQQNQLLKKKLQSQRTMYKQDQETNEKMCKSIQNLKSVINAQQDTIREFNEQIKYFTDSNTQKSLQETLKNQLIDSLNQKIMHMESQKLNSKYIFRYY